MAPRTTTSIRPTEWGLGARPEEPERIVLMLKSGDQVHSVDLTVAQAEELANGLRDEVARRRRMS
ncbi:hypothetical protein QWJ07_31440 [Frankia sp. RB7]|nr:hypothetical protein [Frankia sp. RB7]